MSRNLKSPESSERKAVGISLLGCAALGLVVLFWIGALATALGLFRQVVWMGAALMALAIVGGGGLIGLTLWGDHRALEAFRRRHGEAGRDVLVVYSASPHWESYIEQTWLTRWPDRVVPLNRSDPDWATAPEATLWKRFSGDREHTPIVLVVPPWGRPRIIRFFLAFRDYKHGKELALREKEAELEAAIAKNQRSS